MSDYGIASIEDLSNTEFSTDFFSTEDGAKVTHRKKDYSENPDPEIDRNELSNKDDYAAQSSKLGEPGSSPPVNDEVVKAYSKSHIKAADDIPKTPEPSGTLVPENKSPFRELPYSPLDKTLSHEEAIRKYLSAVTNSRLDEIISSQEFPHVTRKNQSTVNAILKEVYLTTSSDFPPSSDVLSAEASSVRDYQKPARDSSCKPCFGNERKSFAYKWLEFCDTSNFRTQCCRIVGDEWDCSMNFGIRTTRDTCNPQNCDKLNMSGVKGWKTCCNEKSCTVNDPTSSTYNFLLKVRMCCRTKGCQLAAKICDIYEPLVQVEETNLDGIGERQYHYLAADESTDMHLKEDEETSTPASDLAKEQAEGLSLIADESEYEITLPDEDIRESVYVYPVEFSADSKRTSSVSWSMPRDFEPQGSTSQEQVISRATAEADKFRQTPAPVRQGSVFGDVVAKGIPEPVDISTVRPSGVNFKSRIDNMAPNDSQHKQKCCPSLREKFKKKKKKKSVKVDDKEITAWSVPPEHEKRKRTSRQTMPVEEKDEQINTLLNEV